MMGNDLLAQRFEAKFDSRSLGSSGVGEVRGKLRIVKEP